MRNNRFLLGRSGRLVVIYFLSFKVIADVGSRSLRKSALQLPESASDVGKLTRAKLR